MRSGCGRLRPLVVDQASVERRPRAVRHGGAASGRRPARKSRGAAKRSARNAALRGLTRSSDSPAGQLSTRSVSGTLERSTRRSVTRGDDEAQLCRGLPRGGPGGNRWLSGVPPSRRSSRAMDRASPTAGLPEQLPARAAALLRRDGGMANWVPEVHATVIYLAIRELHFGTMPRSSNMRGAATARFSRRRRTACSSGPGRRAPSCAAPHCAGAHCTAAPRSRHGRRTSGPPSSPWRSRHAFCRRSSCAATARGLAWPWKARARATSRWTCTPWSRHGRSSVSGGTDDPLALAGGMATHHLRRRVLPRGAGGVGELR